MELLSTAAAAFIGHSTWSATRCAGVSLSSTFHAEVVSWLSDERLRSEPLATSCRTYGPLLRVSGETGAALAVHLLATPRRGTEVLPRGAIMQLADDWEAGAAFAGADGAGADAPPVGGTNGGGRPLPLVHLWEDQWRTRAPIVRSRLLAMAGESERMMARKTSVRRIDSATLATFLSEHHLWGPTQARLTHTSMRETQSARSACAGKCRWH